MSREKLIRNAVQQVVSIVKARRHVVVNHNFCGFSAKKNSVSSNTVKMEICHMINVLQAVVHAYGLID